MKATNPHIREHKSNTNVLIRNVGCKPLATVHVESPARQTKQVEPLFSLAKHAKQSIFLSAQLDRNGSHDLRKVPAEHCLTTMQLHGPRCTIHQVNLTRLITCNILSFDTSFITQTLHVLCVTCKWDGAWPANTQFSRFPRALHAQCSTGDAQC